MNRFGSFQVHLKVFHLVCVLFSAFAVFISHMNYFIHTDKILCFLSEYCSPSIISFDMTCLSCE